MRKSTSLHLVPSPHLKGRILSALVDHLQNLRQLHPLTSIPLAEWRRRHGLMHPCGCIHRACTRCHQLCGASVMAQYPKAKHWKETTTRTWYFTLPWLPFFFFFFQELLKTTSTMKFQIDSFCPNADGQKSIYSLGHKSYRPGNKTVTVRETSKFLSHPTGWLILEMFLSHIGIQPEWISQSCSKKLGLVPDCTSTASEWSLDIYTQFHHHSNQKPAVPISDLYHY